MYFLQGLLVGLATFAPVGMQNLFIINTALVQPYTSYHIDPYHTGAL